MNIWLVYCPGCAGAFTGAAPPGSADFAEKVNCVKCNKVLHAKYGRFVPIPAKKKEPISLLGVA